MTTLVAIYGGLLIVLVGAATYYVIRVLRSLNEILDATREILDEAKPQVQQILQDASDSTSSVRETVVKIGKIAGRLISIPDFARTFTKHALSSLFTREKR